MADNRGRGQPLRVGIIGVAGRMGQSLVAAAATMPDLQVSGGCEHEASPAIGQPIAPGSPLQVVGSVAQLATRCDVLIDFTLPVALEGNLKAATQAGTPLVIGTTGLGLQESEAIDAAAWQIAVLQAANMSLGVNLLADLVRRAAEKLGEDWDIEVLEMHHRHKVDAPSGTALLLGGAAAQGRGVALEATSVRSRDGITGARPVGSIGFATLRGGSVPGDHSVLFATEDEIITLSHHAQSRMIFARGALKAALWLAGQPAGRYSMKDVLGL